MLGGLKDVSKSIDPKRSYNRFYKDITVMAQKKLIPDAITRRDNFTLYLITPTSSFMTNLLFEIIIEPHYWSYKITIAFTTSYYLSPKTFVIKYQYKLYNKIPYIYLHNNNTNKNCYIHFKGTSSLFYLFFGETWSQKEVKYF